MGLGYDLLDMCSTGPEGILDRTEYCQLAMFIAGLAALEKLKSEKPDKCTRAQPFAGLSIGEMTALCAAGVFDFEIGLQLVKLRGKLMQEQASLIPQGVISVAGLSMQTLSNLCEEAKSGPDDVCQISAALFPNGFSCA